MASQPDIDRNPQYIDFLSISTAIEEQLSSYRQKARSLVQHNIVLSNEKSSLIGKVSVLTNEKNEMAKLVEKLKDEITLLLGQKEVLQKEVVSEGEKRKAAEEKLATIFVVVMNAADEACEY